MKTRRTDPFHVARGMMHGVVLPQKAAVEDAVAPVEQEIGRHKVEDDLLPQRQRGDGPMAVQIEVGDLPAVHDMEYPHGEKHRHPDAHVAHEERREDPVAEVGEEPALVPPGPAFIAGRKPRQKGEHGAEPHQPGQHMPQGDKDLLADVGEQFHGAICSRGHW